MKLLYLLPILFIIRVGVCSVDSNEVGQLQNGETGQTSAPNRRQAHKRRMHRKNKKTTTKKPTTGGSSNKACKCGVSKFNSTRMLDRIVGGQTAQKNQFPWQAALVSNGQKSPFCGGTLVSSKTVVCASHCYNPVSQFKVFLGLYDYTQNTGQVSYTPVSFVTNPSYDPNTVDWDFAVITLDRDVVFTPAISPICLPASPDSFYENKVVTVSGWGTLYSNGPQPNVLQWVQVKTMTNAACTTSPNMYKSTEITQRMICASNPGKDSCQGDSGGPLVYQTSSGHYELVGVVSWGYGCAEKNAPGVYERVTVGKSWIQSLMTGTICTP